METNIAAPIFDVQLNTVWILVSQALKHLIRLICFSHKLIEGGEVIEC